MSVSSEDEPSQGNACLSEGEPSQGNACLSEGEPSQGNACPSRLRMNPHRVMLVCLRMNPHRVMLVCLRMKPHRVMLVFPTDGPNGWSLEQALHLLDLFVSCRAALLKVDQWGICLWPPGQEKRSVCSHT